jgi:O-antigen ligase
LSQRSDDSRTKLDKLKRTMENKNTLTGVPSRGIVLLFFVTLLAGQFGLDRISPDYEDVGPIGQVRFWLFVLLVYLVFRQAEARFKLVRAGTHFFWFVVAFHGYLALTALWTPRMLEGSEQMSSATEVVSMFMLAGFVLIVRRLFHTETQQKTRLLLKLLFFAGGVFAVAGLSGQWMVGERIAAFGGGPNVFARVVAMAVFAGLYSWLQSGRVIWLLPLPVFVGSIILSGSRSGLIALGMSLAFFIIVNRRRIMTTRHGIVVVSCILIAFVALPAVSQEIGAFWQSRFIESSLEDRYDSQRFVLFSDAAATFLNNPIWGIGLDGFRRTNSLGEYYSHNLVLQVAAEGGLVGLTLLGLALGSAIRGCSWSSTLEEQTILTLALLILLAGMFAGSYYDARYMWVFLGIRAVMYQSSRAQVRAATSPGRRPGTVALLPRPSQG